VVLRQVNKLRFGLSIQYDEYLRYYQGSASKVRLRADNGKIIVFPASCLKPFLLHAGIHGRFEITFDGNNRFVSLVRLDDQ